MIDALKTAVDWCLLNHVDIPADVLDGLREIGIGAVKAIQDYDNILTRLMAIRVQELRQPTPPPGHFGEDLAIAIEAGLNEAFRLGLRENDAEMTDEWQAIVDEAIASEKTHIPDLSQYLFDTAPEAENTGEAMQLAGARLEMWIRRYDDLYNQAVLLSADEKTKLEWVYGDTDHCTTCEELNGMVAYAREWDEAGIHPQQPPNGLLECGGWKCQCSLQATNKRHTRNVLDRLLAIAGQQSPE